MDKNFLFKKRAGKIKYITGQVQWLRLIKDRTANSFHVDKADFELDPFNKRGGFRKCGSNSVKKPMQLLTERKPGSIK